MLPIIMASKCNNGTCFAEISQIFTEGQLSWATSGFEQLLFSHDDCSFYQKEEKKNSAFP